MYAKASPFSLASHACSGPGLKFLQKKKRPKSRIRIRILRISNSIKHQKTGFGFAERNAKSVARFKTRFWIHRKEHIWWIRVIFLAEDWRKTWPWLAGSNQYAANGINLSHRSSRVGARQTDSGWVQAYFPLSSPPLLKPVVISLGIIFGSSQLSVSYIILTEMNERQSNSPSQIRLLRLQLPTLHKSLSSGWLNWFS